MSLARPVCADDDVEAFGKFQIGLFEDREFPDPERLEHLASLDEARCRGIVCQKHTLAFRLRLPGSGWIRVGTTQGRGRYEKKNHYDKPKKDIWLRPLRKDWKRVHNR